MKLYGFWRSTATWRVRIALHHKKLEFAYQPVNLRREGGGEQRTAAYARINPMRQVPVLEVEDGGAPVNLAQSMAILHYLEERHPDPPLLPRAAIPRARALQVAEMVASGIQPLQNTTVQAHIREALGADDRAWCHHWVRLGLDAVEAVVATTAGRFAVGDAPSFADLCIVPELYFARRFDVDLTRYPVLTRIEATCATEPAFIAAHADVQPDRPAG
jgi:maleylpyruvate isomerase